MTEFTIFPDHCKVNYACSSVEKVGLEVGETEPIDCTDLTFDGVFDGQETDGKLTFTPNESQYQS